MTITTHKLPDRVPEIKGVEIFRAGDYPQGSVTVEQLDEIVATYDTKYRTAEITKDHIQGGETFGSILRIFRKGKSLYADFCNVAADLVRDIRAGKWKTRSVELRREDNGKYYLTAVTMLGALQPAVAGMEPIKFADQTEGVKTAAVECDNSAFEIVQFSEIKAPEGATFGTLTKTEYSGTNLDHWHSCYLDAEGNGFTGPALKYDSEYNLVSEDGGHQHVVTAWAISPAGEPTHTHELTRVEIETTCGPEEMNMSKIEVDKIEFDAMKTKADEHAALVARAEKAENDLKSFRDAAATEAKERKFDASFAKAASEGRIAESERANAKTLYMAQPDGVLKFADGEKSPADAFLASIESRPVMLSMKSEGADGKGAQRTEQPTATDDKGVAKDAEIKKFMAANPSVTYAAALIAVEKKSEAAS
jgi:hypothetical protein